MKVAVIGAGNIFQSNHLPVLKRLQCEITLVVEPSEAVVSAIKPILFPYTKYVSDISQGDFSEVDVVLIASPTSFHYAQVKYLSQQDVHVFCEKPIAIHPEEARELVTLYAQNKKILQVGFNRRFQPVAKYLQKAIAERTYGSLRNVVCRCGWVAKDLPASILNKKLSGGGITLDYGVHVIDRILSWSKDVKVLRYRDDSHEGIETSSVIDLQITTLSGDTAYVTVLLSWSNVMSNAIQLNFDKATIINGFNNGSYLDMILLKHQYKDTRYTIQKDKITLDEEDAVEAQWKEFFGSIEGKTPAISSLDHAVKTIDVVAACYKIKEPLNQSWGL